MQLFWGDIAAILSRRDMFFHLQAIVGLKHFLYHQQEATILLYFIKEDMLLFLEEWGLSISVESVDYATTL